MVVNHEDWNSYDNAMFANDQMQSLEASADHQVMNLQSPVGGGNESPDGEAVISSEVERGCLTSSGKV